MKKRNFFVAKFALVAVMIGFFSPSITVEEAQTTSNLVSKTSLSTTQDLLARLSTTDISISLFTQAEARRGKRRGHRRGKRRAHRRANYRHHKRHHRRHKRRNAGRVLGGIAAGVAIGAAISHSNNRSRCETLYVRGLRYEDCGDGLRRY